MTIIRRKRNSYDSQYNKNKRKMWLLTPGSSNSLLYTNIAVLPSGCSKNGSRNMEKRTRMYLLSPNHKQRPAVSPVYQPQVHKRYVTRRTYSAYAPRQRATSDVSWRTCVETQTFPRIYP